jgi:hypothetical protein
LLSSYALRIIACRWVRLHSCRRGGGDMCIDARRL